MRGNRGQEIMIEKAIYGKEVDPDRKFVNYEISCFVT
jgi:hypothetical protein